MGSNCQSICPCLSHHMWACPAQPHTIMFYQPLSPPLCSCSPSFSIFFFLPLLAFILHQDWWGRNTWTHTHTSWTALICIVWFVHWLIAVWNISSCPLWVKAWLKDRKTKTLQADKLSHQFRCSYCVNSLNRNLTLTCVWRQKDKTRQRLPCVFQLSRSMMFFL